MMTNSTDRMMRQARWVAAIATVAVAIALLVSGVTTTNADSGSTALSSLEFTDTFMGGTPPTIVVTNSDIWLSPAFDADTLNYTANIWDIVPKITVAAIPSDAAASVSYLNADDEAIPDADQTAVGHQIDLDSVGDTIKVQVTQGTQSSVYVVTPTKRQWVFDPSHEDGHGVLPDLLFVSLNSRIDKWVPVGTEMDVWVRFKYLEDDSTYTVRADVKGSNECEGAVLGVDHSVRRSGSVIGAISDQCPEGEYTLVATLESPQGETTTVEEDFAVGDAYKPIVIVTSDGPDPCIIPKSVVNNPDPRPGQRVSEDFLSFIVDLCSGVGYPPAAPHVTLRLSESEITLEWESRTMFACCGYWVVREDYNDQGELVGRHSVPPTEFVYHAETTYTEPASSCKANTRCVYTVTQVDAAGVGEPSKPIEVVSKTSETMREYTVRFRIADLALSDDATLSGLTLSGISLDFDPAIEGYAAASVDNDVAETTVTATTNDAGASYAVRLGGVEDADRTVSLAVGRNEITVVVTAEDGKTTRTYAVIVTRAAPPLSTDATLSDLALSGVAFGTFDQATTVLHRQRRQRRGRNHRHSDGERWRSDPRNPTGRG